MENNITEHTQSDEPIQEDTADYFWSIGIIGLGTLIDFGVISATTNSELGWPHYLGSGLAFTTLTIVSAAILTALFSGIPKHKKQWPRFVSNLTFPLIISSAFWIWRAAHVTEIGNVKYREREAAQRLIEEMEDNEKLRGAAEPVLLRVRLQVEADIKRQLKDGETIINVSGWSASSIGGTKWLVKFEFESDGSPKWLLFEYDNYLETVKSVFSEDVLVDRYLEKSESGSSLKLPNLKWYGPVL